MTPDDFTALKLKVGKLTDKLGMPIDPGILETVAALRAHGINTIGSCEGHADRITGGPYVMFEAPDVGPDEKAYRAIPDRLSPIYKNFYNAATAKNVAEVQKVLIHLDEFYKNRTTPANQRLIIHYFGPLAGKLACQGAGLAHILPPKEQAYLLKKSQTEMQAFTDFLIALKVKSPRAA